MGINRAAKPSQREPKVQEPRIEIWPEFEAALGKVGASITKRRMTGNNGVPEVTVQFSEGGYGTIKPNKGPRSVDFANGVQTQVDRLEALRSAFKGRAAQFGENAAA